MSNRSTQVMLVLVILGGALWWTSIEEDYTPQGSTPDAILRIVSFDRSAVERIDITRGGDEISVRRADDGWRAVSAWDYQANTSTIDDLLGQLQQIADADLRGEREASHGTFEIEAGSAIKVLLTGEGKGLPLELMIGKADGFDRSFIRLGTSNQVYSVTPNIRYSSGFGGTRLDSSNWIDTKLYSLAESSEAKAITMVTPDGVVRIERDPIEEAAEPQEGGETPPAPEKWSVVDPEKFQADSRIVTGLLSTLKNVSAAEGLDPVTLPDLGLDPPERAFEIELASGEVVALHFGPAMELAAGGNGFPCRRLGDGRIFGAQAWVADGLFKTVDQFRMPAPDPPPTPAVEEVTPLDGAGSGSGGTPTAADDAGDRERR